MTQSPWDDTFEEILRTHCQSAAPEDSIDPEMTFVHLGVDSMGLLNMMFDCEKRFSIEFTIDMLAEQSLTTPAQFWLTLEQLIREERGVELCGSPDPKSSPQPSINLARRDLVQLTALAKTRLRRMQYQPGLIDGFLAGTRLSLHPLCNPPAIEDR